MNEAPSFLQLKTAIPAFLSFLKAPSAVDTIEIFALLFNGDYLYIAPYENIFLEVLAHFQLFAL